MSKNDQPLHSCRIAGIEEELLCGKVTVFENRQTRSGREIALNVVVMPAVDPSGERAPLFHLDGGPGVAATNAAHFYAAFGQGYRQDRDIVLVDQRGTGESNPLHCPGLEHYDGKAQSYLQEMYPVKAVEACREELEKNADLTLYTTPVAAADLEQVRETLGYERVDLFGLSYGTRLALVYMRMFPGRVRSAVLWGVVPMDAKMPLQHAASGQRAMDLLLDDCEEDSSCRGAFPAIRSEWAELLEHLDDAPARVSFARPGEQGQVLEIPRDIFAAKVRGQMYTPQGAREIPFLVSQAAAGDFSPFLERVIPEEPTVPGFVADGLFLSITCSEDVVRIEPDEASGASAGTFLGDYRVIQQQRACEHWPKAKLPSAYHEPVVSDIPALILSGYMDPVTPPAWGDAVASHLSRSRHVVIRHHAHLPDGLTNIECFDEMMLAFYREGTAEDLDVECSATMQPPPFVTSGS